MDNLEWLKEMKSLDETKENYWNKDYREAKALEIIAGELIRHNNYIEEYGTELKGVNQIKVNLDSLKRSKGFTKKVMGKNKKRRGEKNGEKNNGRTNGESRNEAK